MHNGLGFFLLILTLSKFHYFKNQLTVLHDLKKQKIQVFDKVHKNRFHDNTDLYFKLRSLSFG